MTESVNYEEYSVHCMDGIVLKGRRYKPSSPSSSSSSSPKYRILAWHGWMDNHNTFWKLAPTLVQALGRDEIDLVALDLPGHGQSSHKSLDGPTAVLMEYVYYVHEALQALEWQPNSVTLIGHSMGGAVSMLYSAAFPVRNLILLDSLGPWIREGGSGGNGCAKHLRSHIRARIRGKDPQSIYESFDKAVEARMLTATTFPGNQWISKETAIQLVQGASKILPDGRLEFSHDQRLKLPSILYLTQEQINEIFKTVAESVVADEGMSTRVCLLMAKDGMPFTTESVSNLCERLKPKLVETLPGSHHFHSDPDTADQVAQTILSFLQQE